MKSHKFLRFVAHHQKICTALFAILPVSVCAIALTAIQAGPGAYVIFPVLFILLCKVFCTACANQLISYATKELYDKCNPNPLLQETTDALKYTKEGVNRQILIIDYAMALGTLGEHEFAYQQLSKINIDKHAGMLPAVKVIYYNNLGYYAHLLGKSETADFLHQKALTIYDTLKKGKQKDYLKTTMLSSQASACLRAGDPMGAMSYASQMTPDSPYAVIDHSWLFSEIYLAQNDTLSAKKYLEVVASSNPSLYIVKEAKRLLSEIE